jgi:hypothetical protein
LKTLPRLAASALALALIASPTHAAFAADTAEIAALKKQIQALAAKVESMEAAQKTEKAEAAKTAETKASAEAVTKGSFPGSFKIPGTDTSVKIGGYVKADILNDVGQSYGAAFSTFNNIPLDGSIQKDRSFETNFSTKQTRLNLETRTATSLGEAKTFVEIDFFGNNTVNSNLSGYAPQLRLAYGSLAGFTAGQAFSNFMDTGAANESLDYLGSAARVFVRQGQVRYERGFGDLTVSGSVEGRIMADNTTAGSTMFTAYGTGATGTSRMAMPDMTLRGDYKYAKDGYVSVRGLLVQNNIDHNATGSSDNSTATDIGFGVGVSGKQGTWGKDYVSYDLNYGDGTGRYIYDIGTTANLYNQATGKLHGVQYFAATAGYQHHWSDAFRDRKSVV